MGAAKKYGRRAGGLPFLQVSVLEQAAQIQAQGAVVSIFQKSLAERAGIRTRGSLLRPGDSSRSMALQATAINRSAISPSKGAGENLAAQTSISHLRSTTSSRQLTACSTNFQFPSSFRSPRLLATERNAALHSGFFQFFQ
jgi:hypothetical protein